MWANLTDLRYDPRLGPQTDQKASGGTLLINARVNMAPVDLETIVRDALAGAVESHSLQFDIVDLQSFSPAYPNPPYRIKEGAGS